MTIFRAFFFSFFRPLDPKSEIFFPGNQLIKNSGLGLIAQTELAKVITQHVFKHPQ